MAQARKPAKRVARPRAATAKAKIGEQFIERWDKAEILGELAEGNEEESLRQREYGTATVRTAVSTGTATGLAPATSGVTFV